MKKKITLEWFVAAAIRAIKTFAQTAIGMIGVGAVALNDVNWIYVFSAAALAAIMSILMSLAGLPEVGTDGTLQIDTSNPDKDVYRLQMDTPFEKLAEKSKVSLCVDPKAHLS